MEDLIAVLIGIGLSAACGFRIFVPLLGMSIAHHAGHLSLSPGFEWIGSWPATIAFAVATVVEIAAYYIPWVANLLDLIATPAAIVAGVMAVASVVGDLSPFLRWSVAIIAGGGVAGVIQGSSVAIRGASTAATGGAGNPVVATGELLASAAGTILSIALPFVAALFVLIVIVLILRQVLRLRAQTT